MSLPRALAALLATAAVGLAQPPAATPAPKPADPAKPTEPAKPVEAKKEEPKPAEPTDVKTFTFATDAEFTDAVQQFALLFGKMTAKPADAPKPAPGTPTAAAKGPKFTALARAKSIAVRGTKTELDTAETVVKVLQGTADGKTAQVVKLKNANVQEVTQALAALDLGDGVVALRGSNAVVLLNADAALVAQVKKVVEACEKFDPKAAKPTGGD